MNKKYYKKIFEEIKTSLSFYDRILLKLFKKYTYRILRKGIDIGFNWEDKEYECQPKHEKVNDLSTEYK